MYAAHHETIHISVNSSVWIIQKGKICLFSELTPFGRAYSGGFSNFHQRTQKVTSKPREYFNQKFQGKIQAASELGGKKV